MPPRPQRARPAAGAPLPDRPRHPVLADLCAGHQARPPQPARRPRDHGRGAGRQGRLFAASHRPLRPRRASSCSTWAGPTATTAPAGSPCSTTTPSTSSAPGSTTAGDQYFGYDGWWHLNHDTMITSEWGTPSMIENGLNPEDLLGQAVRPPPQLLVDVPAHPHPAGRPGRPAPDGVRGPPGPRPGQGLGVRRGGHQRRGPLRLGVPLVPRRRPVGGPQGDHHPRRAGRPRPAPPGPQAVRGGAPAGLRHRPVGGRPLAVCVVLGHRGAQAVRRQPTSSTHGRPARSASAASWAASPTRPRPTCAWVVGRRWWRSAATAAGCM